MLNEDFHYALYRERCRREDVENKMLRLRKKLTLATRIDIAIAFAFGASLGVLATFLAQGLTP